MEEYKLTMRSEEDTAAEVLEIARISPNFRDKQAIKAI